MKTTGYSRPLGTGLVFHLGGAYTVPAMISSDFNNSNIDFTGNGKLQGQIFTKTVGSPGKVRVLYRAMDPNRYADGEIVAEADTLSDGTFLIEGLNENFYYDVIAHNEGWNDRVFIKVKPVASQPTLKAPSNVQAVESISGDTILINWSKVGAPAEGIRVYRSISPITDLTLLSPLVTLGPNATIYEDNNNLVLNTTYYYAVSAFLNTEEKYTTIDPITLKEGDPFWNTVKSLVHFDGANNSTVITDQISGNTWSVVGSAKLDTDRKKFGDSALNLMSGESGVSVNGIARNTNSELFNFGSGDYTIECWVYVRQATTYGVLFSNRLSSADNSSVIVQQNAANGSWRMACTNSSGQWVAVVDSSTPFPIGEWQHVALVRNGNVLRLYQNGKIVCEAIQTDSIIHYPSQSINLGNDGNGGTPTYGSIDDFRVSTMARYLSPFTPIQKPFPSKQGVFKTKYWNTTNSQYFTVNAAAPMIAIPNRAAVDDSDWKNQVFGETVKNSGKHYFELYSNLTNAQATIGGGSTEYGGLIDSTFAKPVVNPPYDILSLNTGYQSCCWRRGGGGPLAVQWRAGQATEWIGGNLSENDGTVGFAVDFSNRSIWININGKWVNDKNPLNTPDSVYKLDSSSTSVVPFTTTKAIGSKTVLRVRIDEFSNVTPSDFESGGVLNGFSGWE